MLDTRAAPLHVADLPTGPYFLDDLAHRQLQSFSRGAPMEELFKLLALVGPVKSGKSALLTKVIPGMLSAEYELRRAASAAAGVGPLVRPPVCFHFSFDLAEGPAHAARSLLRSASRFALSQRDFHLEVPPSPADCLGDLGELMGDFAKGFFARGGELCILLDETQAPILRARMPEEAARFASKLKALATACAPVSRIAFTGSGMVTLLNALRNVPTNGVALWDVMTRVHLGFCPSGSTAEALASAIVAHRAQKAAWPQLVAEALTGPRILRALDPAYANQVSPSSGKVAAAPRPRWTSSRPALIAYLAQLMGNANVGSAEEILLAALTALEDKVRAESQVDAAVALRQLRPEMRKSLYALARGFQQRDRELTFGRSGLALLHVLCDPHAAGGASSAGEAPLSLSPPYGALFLGLLGANGEVLLSWDKGRWVLNKRLVNRIHFFFEHRTHLMRVRPDLVVAISVAVLQSLSSNGIGVPTGNGSEPFRPPRSLSEVAAMPAVCAVFRLLDSQQDVTLRRNGSDAARSRRSVVVEFDRHLASAETQSSVDYLAHVGFHMLTWVQHIAAHAYLPKSAISEAGLDAEVLSAAVDAAVAQWMAGNIGRMSASGVPQLRVRGPLSAPA